MIALTGIDMIIEKAVDDSVIASAVAIVLAIAVERVVVITDIVEYPTKAAFDIVLLRHSIEGQFATLISLSCAARSIESTESLARSVSRQLHCSVLIPDDSTDDPDAMLLANDVGEVRQVQLDADALNQERYCLLP
jgi:hypothetical protein